MAQTASGAQSQKEGTTAKALTKLTLTNYAVAELFRNPGKIWMYKNEISPNVCYRYPRSRSLTHFFHVSPPFPPCYSGTSVLFSFIVLENSPIPAPSLER
jgi:hypothetical protein